MAAHFERKKFNEFDAELEWFNFCKNNKNKEKSSKRKSDP